MSILSKKYPIDPSLKDILVNSYGFRVKMKTLSPHHPFISLIRDMENSCTIVINLDPRSTINCRFCFPHEIQSYQYSDSLKLLDKLNNFINSNHE